MSQPAGTASVGVPPAHHPIEAFETRDRLFGGSFGLVRTSPRGYAKILSIHTSTTASASGSSDSTYLEAHERDLVVARLDREHTRR
eukprot:3274108-Pleurochrysis_carterae.AAC.1